MAEFDVNYRKATRVVKPCDPCPPCPTYKPEPKSCSCGGTCGKCKDDACGGPAILGGLAGAATGFAVGGPIGAIIGFFVAGGATQAVCESISKE
ncbi:MAG TPA: hypothetical protein VD866_01260 [Urbifossiella sp.]|nr:hypothetical protein [Urbifossiella sp.]